MGIDFLASQLQMLTSSKCMCLVWCESVVLYIHVMDAPAVQSVSSINQLVLLLQFKVCICTVHCVASINQLVSPTVQSVCLQPFSWL